MRTLYFIRHGQSEANVLRVISNRGQVHGLTDLGRQQASSLAEQLRDSNAGITKIYSSPLLRARQTAEILAQGLASGLGTGGALPIEITDALREFDCGAVEGRADEAAWQIHNTLCRDWAAGLKLDNRIPGGESFMDLQQRFVPFIASLIAQDEFSLALVGHGGLYFAMLPLVLANISRQFIWTHHISNAAYILAEAGEEGLICREWNREDVKG